MSLRMKRKTTFWLGVALHAFFIQAAAQYPEFKYENGHVWVTGLSATSQSTTHSVASERWSDILRVYTNEAVVKKLNQPVGGTYAWHGDGLSFKPYFNLAAGETYHCFFNYQTLLRLTEGTELLKESEKILEFSFQVPEKKSVATEIVSVHPQADELPENMLRMYVYFSASMSPGEAYNHIHLKTEEGNVVEKAFLIVDSELWDSERKRFTLLFDPGRVKRGIRSNLELGSPLKQGQSYQLVIDSTWRDANGNFLAQSFTKSFHITSAIRTVTSPRNWDMTTPSAGTLEPLMIAFDRPIDHALALKYILVTSQSEIVTGKITLTGSTIWKFTPDQPWKPGEHQIEVSPLLEDVAGNNLNNPFDVDITKAKRVSSVEIVKLMFTVAGPVK